MIITKVRKLKKIEDEDWREVPKSKGRYFISNYGRVKSFMYNKEEGQFLKLIEGKGFHLVHLTIDNVGRKYFIHKLIAEIWLVKPSENHTFVTHLDGNLKNNHPSNLEWHTKESLIEKHREFTKQKYANTKRPIVINSSKLKVADVIHLKKMLKRGVVQSRIAKLFSISEMQVTRIKRGENWGHVQI